MRTIVLDGMPHLCLFALRDIAPEEEISYNYGDADWPWRKQVTNEQYYPEAVEEESFPLELTSLKELSSLRTSTTDRSSTEFQVTNEQYYPEAVEEESFPLELTSLKELSSLKTSTTDRSSTEVI
ncbi:hypothetical protein JOQ06_017475, partial [Pogonophryne albipinna]